MFHGVWNTILFVAPILVTGGLFEQKSWKTILINIGYWAVTLMIMGGVLDSMNHWVSETAIG